MAILNGTNRADTLNGSAGDDEIFGGNGNDTLFGNEGDDFLFGDNGSDLISGGAGDDGIDGGRGNDTLLLAGNRADYHFSESADGSIVVRDLRPGSPDGTDRLSNMERVRFADGTFKIGDLISANAAPVAADDAFTLSEDAGATDVTALLLGNDSDVDGDALTITAVGVSASGAAVTLNADGTVSYDAGSLFNYLAAGETATDSFTYTITDAAGLTSTATATVTITGADEQVDAAFYVQEDGPSEELLGLLEDWLNIDIVGVGTAGTLGSVAYDGSSLVFTADDPYSDHLNYDSHHTTTFTVTGSNGEVKTVMAVIEGINDDPVANDDAYTLIEGGTSANLYFTVKDNDTDVDGYVPIYEIASVDTTGTQGTVFFDAYNRVLTYSADGIELAAGETITDSFSYVLDDSYGGYDTATVTFTITAAEDGTLMMTSSQEEGGDAILAAFVAEDETETFGAELAGFGPQAEMIVADVPIA